MYEFEAGQKVVLCNLQLRPHCNGLQAIVVDGPHPETRRVDGSTHFMYDVKLPDGQLLRLAPSRLTPTGDRARGSWRKIEQVTGGWNPTKTARQTARIRRRG